MSALLRVALCCVGFEDAETVEHVHVTKFSPQFYLPIFTDGIRRDKLSSCRGIVNAFVPWRTSRTCVVLTSSSKGRLLVALEQLFADQVDTFAASARFVY